MIFNFNYNIFLLHAYVLTSYNKEEKWRGYNNKDGLIDNSLLFIQSLINIFKDTSYISVYAIPSYKFVLFL